MGANKSQLPPVSTVHAKQTVSEGAQGLFTDHLLTGQKKRRLAAFSLASVLACSAPFMASMPSPAAINPMMPNAEALAERANQEHSGEHSADKGREHPRDNQHSEKQHSEKGKASGQHTTPTMARPEHAADNSAANKERATRGTADQQDNNADDVALIRKIRQSLVDDKTLSTYAHNVKILAHAGQVTLKGPVHSAQEKRVVEEIAGKAAGKQQVTSQLSVVTR